jgi:hypothetical protein
MLNIDPQALERPSLVAGGWYWLYWIGFVVWCLPLSVVQAQIKAQVHPQAQTVSKRLDEVVLVLTPRELQAMAEAAET